MLLHLALAAGLTAGVNGKVFMWSAIVAIITGLYK